MNLKTTKLIVIILSIVVITSVVLFVVFGRRGEHGGRNELTTQQKVIADEAINSLKKLNAATEVGVNYQNYGMLLIEAKVKVNEAQAQLPDGDLKSEIVLAMDCYKDAITAWDDKIKLAAEQIPFRYGESRPLVVKYGLAAQAEPSSIGYRIQVEELIKVIWLSAKNHLDRADAFRNGLVPPIRSTIQKMQADERGL
jgi:hypothetical protein